MNRMFRRKLLGAIAWTLGVLLMVPAVSAGTHKTFPEKYSDIYMPVSLGVGTVRTPEFRVVSDDYDIIIQAQRVFPISQMICMMAATWDQRDKEDCTSADPLLQAEWKVWNEGHLVARGSIDPSGGAKISKDQIWKSVGAFGGEAGKKYVVEVKFTKDGTPLNVAEPRLIVIKHKDFW